MSKPLVHQIAERARGLIADPRKWTQYAIARTGNNRHCEPTDAKATRFCAYGAILRAAFATFLIPGPHRFYGVRSPPTLV